MMVYGMDLEVETVILAQIPGLVDTIGVHLKTQIAQHGLLIFPITIIHLVQKSIPLQLGQFENLVLKFMDVQIT